MTSTLSTLDISNLGSSEERIAARRARAETKLKQDKEEAEGKKTKKDDAAEQVRNVCQRASVTSPYIVVGIGVIQSEYNYTCLAASG